MLYKITKDTKREVINCKPELLKIMLLDWHTQNNGVEILAEYQLLGNMGDIIHTIVYHKPEY